MTLQQLFDFPLHTVMTFETFITCDGNASALHFAQKIADPDEPEKLLYLHGPAGSGKSHLLSAVCQKINNNSLRGSTVVSCRTLSEHDDLVSLFSSSYALLLDDLDQLPDSDDMRGVIWQTFNDCYAAGRPIVVSGCCPPRELLLLDNHLISRLLWGLVASTDASDDMSRRMILKKISDDRNVRIPDDVINYLLMTTSREVGHLVAVFDQLYCYSLASKRKITLSLARQFRDKSSLGAPV